MSNLLTWQRTGDLHHAEAPDGELYVLAEHPQSPEKFLITKGMDLHHRPNKGEPHTFIDVVTGLYAAQRVAETDAATLSPTL